MIISEHPTDVFLLRATIISVVATATNRPCFQRHRFRRVATAITNTIAIAQEPERQMKIAAEPFSVSFVALIFLSESY